jgi:hypothetical protein
MRKVALNFGIKTFDPNYYGSGNDLRGCENDILYIEKIAKQKGFETNTFLSKNATYKKYVEFLTKMGDELVAGDVFLFAVSCHGTYEDFQELGEEKRRTALCLYDRIVWDYETKNLLMRFKEGVTVVWISDCCHARDNFKMVTQQTNAQPKSLNFSDIVGVKAKELDVPEQFQEQSDIKCNIIAFSSSTEHQVSYDLQSFVDKRPMGLFTASLEKILLSPSNLKLNYYQIYKALTKQVATAGYPQTPKLQVINGHKDKITYREFLT